MVEPQILPIPAPPGRAVCPATSTTRLHFKGLAGRSMGWGMCENRAQEPPPAFHSRSHRPHREHRKKKNSHHSIGMLLNTFQATADGKARLQDSRVLSKTHLQGRERPWLCHWGQHDRPGLCPTPTLRPPTPTGVTEYSMHSRHGPDTYCAGEGREGETSSQRHHHVLLQLSKSSGTYLRGCKGSAHTLGSSQLSSLCVPQGSCATCSGVLPNHNADT